MELCDCDLDQFVKDKPFGENNVKTFLYQMSEYTSHIHTLHIMIGKVCSGSYVPYTLNFLRLSDFPLKFFRCKIFMVCKSTQLCTLKILITMQQKHTV